MILEVMDPRSDVCLDDKRRDCQHRLLFSHELSNIFIYRCYMGKENLAPAVMKVDADIAEEKNRILITKNRLRLASTSPKLISIA